MKKFSWESLINMEMSLEKVNKFFLKNVHEIHFLQTYIDNKTPVLFD